MRSELRPIRALDYCARMVGFGVDPLSCLEGAVRDEKVDELVPAKIWLAQLVGCQRVRQTEASLEAGDDA
jgi:hypothetical protein